LLLESCLIFQKKRPKRKNGANRHWHISARKRAESRRELYFRAREAIDQAVIVTDAGGRIIEINRAFSEFYGYSRDETLGMNPRFLNPDPEVYANLGYSQEEYQALFEGLWSAVTDPSRGTWEGVVVNRRKNGNMGQSSRQRDLRRRSRCPEPDRVSR
jgi:PAS domain S-box-containing protein